jgi:hypothetical protein
MEARNIVAATRVDCPCNTKKGPYGQRRSLRPAKYSLTDVARALLIQDLAGAMGINDGVLP